MIAAAEKRSAKIAVYSASTATTLGAMIFSVAIFSSVKVTAAKSSTVLNVIMAKRAMSDLVIIAKKDFASSACIQHAGMIGQMRA